MRERFDLPAELTIYSSLETRDALVGWLAKQDLGTASPLLVGGSEVTDIDGAGVQLLASLAASVAQRGDTWRLVAPSEALQSACRTLGFTAWMDADSLAKEAA